MNFYDFYEMNQESYGHAFIVIIGIAPTSGERAEYIFYEVCDESGILLTDDKSCISVDDAFMKFLSPSIQGSDLLALVGKRFEIDFEIFDAEGKNTDDFYDVNDEGTLGVVIERVREVTT